MDEQVGGWVGDCLRKRTRRMGSCCQHLIAHSSLPAASPPALLMSLWPVPPPAPSICAQELWRHLEAVADRLGLRLGAPAAAPCGADCLTPNPFDWWDEFFQR